MSHKTNLALDLSLFGAFVVAYNQRLTGGSLHEWIGVGFAVAILAHLLLHWNWIANVTTRFFKKLSSQSRLNFAVDALFFIAMIGTSFSGLMISESVLSTVGIQLGEVSRNWKMLHTLTADASLILLGIHFALHWKWVAAQIGRTMVNPVRRLVQRSRPGDLALQPQRVDEQF